MFMRFYDFLQMVKASLCEYAAMFQSIFSHHEFDRSVFNLKRTSSSAHCAFYLV